MIKKEFRGINPEIHEDTFIAENAVIIGDVHIKKNANIWYGAVLRGDINSITVGEGSNIQENCTVHVGDKEPVIMGKGVTVGHNCIIHGCSIGDYCLIGMGSTILNGAKIGANCLIGAGSLVTGNKEIPEGSLCLGSPAKFIRKLTEEEIKNLKSSAENYIKISKEYK